MANVPARCKRLTNPLPPRVVAWRRCGLLPNYLGHLPSRSITRTVSSELLSFCFQFSVTCARLRWPCCQLLSACKYTVSYRTLTSLLRRRQLVSLPPRQPTVARCTDGVRYSLSWSFSDGGRERSSVQDVVAAKLWMPTLVAVAR